MRPAASVGVAPAPTQSRPTDPSCPRDRTLEATLSAMSAVMEQFSQSIAMGIQFEIHRRDQQSAQRQREHEFHMAALKAVTEARR